MNVSDLDYSYPERLVAIERAAVSRIMFVTNGEPRELSGVTELIEGFQSGDCLVLNDTRVLRRRVFSKTGLEILFLNSLESPNSLASLNSLDGCAPLESHKERHGDESLLSGQLSTAGRLWQVLCPSSRWKEGTEQTLPGGVSLKILSRGRPQVVEASEPLLESYFEQQGELPLPPYIQKARGERHNRPDDFQRYQTDWARKDGSLAAPTASLHFTREDLDQIRARGVKIVEVTLHVGLGTFLPVVVEHLDQHIMHSEVASVPGHAWRTICQTKEAGGRVWALGTTVTRTLESASNGRLQSDGHGGFHGETDLFIRPGFQFKTVDVLLTNFHQPRSTLLALVAAFAGLDAVKQCYSWAIERDFRLFSYGDLSAWSK